MSQSPQFQNVCVECVSVFYVLRLVQRYRNFLIDIECLKRQWISFRTGKSFFFQGPASSFNLKIILVSSVTKLVCLETIFLHPFFLRPHVHLNCLFMSVACATKCFVFFLVLQEFRFKKKNKRFVAMLSQKKLVFFLHFGRQLDAKQKSFFLLFDGTHGSGFLVKMIEKYRELPLISNFGGFFEQFF